MKNFETFFTLCSPEDEGQTGSGAYSGDVGEGENDTPDVEYVDPLDDADGNLDKEETNGTVITDNGEMETVVEGTGDANPIDPVEVVTTPTEPNNENPDDNPEDDSNWGMDEDENSAEGDVEEEEQDDESGDDEPTPDTPPQEERVKVEDGQCVMGSLASVVQKLLNVPASTAINIAIVAMRNKGINPFPANGSNGINLNNRTFVDVVNSISGLRVLDGPNASSDRAIANLFMTNSNVQGIAITTKETYFGEEIDHFRHIENYMGNGYYKFYDPTTGETGYDNIKNGDYKNTYILIIQMMNSND